MIFSNWINENLWICDSFFYSFTSLNELNLWDKKLNIKLNIEKFPEHIFHSSNDFQPLKYKKKNVKSLKQFFHTKFNPINL